MKVTKMQGAGNDFILLDGINNIYENIGEMALKLCDRHFGIGADGIMICQKSDVADIKMVYYNSDGSFGEMCGNGIRCFSKFVYENGLCPQEEITIETAGGIKKAFLTVEEKKVLAIEIDMGLPIFEESAGLLRKIEVDGEEIEFTTLLMDVPHIVVFVEEMDKVDINGLGAALEIHPLFPKKTNVNFVQIISRDNIKIKTWERGAGHTLACGTGCCSAFISGNRLGFLDSMVKVEAEGGTIYTSLGERGNIFMKGEAKTILIGEFLPWKI